MATIVLTLPEGEKAYNGKQVTFQAPCDCVSVGGITLDGDYYAIVDAMGRNVLEEGSFCSGAYVTVILDVTNHLAYIQNRAVRTIRVGTAEPDDSLGVDGDIYIQIIE